MNDSTLANMITWLAQSFHVKFKYLSFCIDDTHEIHDNRSQQNG